MCRVRVCTSASRTATWARSARLASEFRCAGRYAPSSQASRRARASRRSVFTLRLRCAYIGAKFGSATITSCPRSSKHYATHSLSVGAAPPLDELPRFGPDADLACVFVHVDSNMVHGWPPLAALDHVLCVWGIFAPRRGGQPLHLIYAPFAVKASGEHSPGSTVLSTDS